MDTFNLAIVGATGLAGREFIKVLEQEKFPVASIRLLASEHSSQREIFFDHQSISVEETVNEAFQNMDVVLFFTSTDVSRRLAPIASNYGATVIDNSTAFNGDAEVPLVVPEVNAEDIQINKGIIANPSSGPFQLAIILKALHQSHAIKRVIVSTYQSVSSSGTAALKELTSQSRLVLDGYRVCPHIYAHQIAFNILPEIGLFLDSGFTKEEQRVVDDTHKILHDTSIPIAATCARVPVYFSDSAAVNIEFESAINPDNVRRILADTPGVRVIDDSSVSLYPQPWAVTGSNRVFVGRIRRDSSLSTNGIILWTVVDNIHRVAALNSLHILEEGINRGYIKAKRKQEVQR